MLLSHRTSVKIRPEYSNIIGHMCYAASKLWNVCNYERHHYKELGLEKYPDWYYQKKAHKGDLWYRQLPSQTAQETCKQLDKAWRSFYVLKKTGGIKDPNPPRFKQDNIPVTYMQMGMRHEKGSDQLRLSLPKDLKSYMEETYGDVYKRQGFLHICLDFITAPKLVGSFFVFKLSLKIVLPFVIL